MRSLIKIASLFLTATVPLGALATPVSFEPCQEHIGNQQLLKALETKYAFLTFYGADPDAFFDMSIPANGSLTRITNQLSVSKVESKSPAACGLTGVDGSITTVGPGETVDIGPPQAQLSAVCFALGR